MFYLYGCWLHYWCSICENSSSHILVYFCASLCFTSILKQKKLTPYSFLLLPKFKTLSKATAFFHWLFSRIYLKISSSETGIKPFFSNNKNLGKSPLPQLDGYLPSCCPIWEQKIKIHNKNERLALHSVFR